MLSPDSIASIVGAGVHTLGGLFGRKMQQDSNMKMWNAMNEYNTPANQIRRMREAGFNPAHLFGQMSVDSGEASAPPESASFSDMFNSAGNMVNTAINAGLMSAQKRKLTAEAEKAEQDAQYTEQQKVAQQLRNDFLPQMLDNEVSLQDLEKRLRESNIGLTDETISKITAETQNLRQKARLMDKELEMYVETLRKAKSEADIQELQAKATPEFIRKQFEQYNSNIKLTQQQAEQASAMVKSINKDTDIKELERGMLEIASQFAFENESIKASTLKQENLLTQNRNAQENLKRKRMAEGQSTAEYVAPIAEFCGAFGNLLGGLTHK